MKDETVGSIKLIVAILGSIGLGITAGWLYGVALFVILYMVW